MSVRLPISASIDPTSYSRTAADRSLVNFYNICYSELYQVIASKWLRTFYPETLKDHYSLYCFYSVSWLNASAACHGCHCLAAKVVGLLPLRTCLTLLNLLSQVTERLCSSFVSYRSKAVTITRKLSSSPYQKCD